MITKTDKSRASYYNYYTNKKWGAAAGYSLCVASGELAPVILPHCLHKIYYRENLVLDGLYRLYQKNTK